MIFGERIKHARELAGLNQKELAKLSGIKQPSIAYLENPKKNAQSSRYTAAIAKACKVNLEWLTTGTGAIGKPGTYDMRGTVVPLHTGENMDSPINELIGIAKTMSERGIYELIGRAKEIAKAHPKAQANHAE